jgi:hypothetical protein
VDADELDGYDAGDLIRFAGDSTDALALVGLDGDAATTSIVAPDEGFFVISASADVFGDAPGPVVECVIQVDNVDVDSSYRELRLSADNTQMICATDAFYEVSAGGTYDIDFHFELQGTTTVNAVVLNVLYVPFRSDGLPPSAEAP